MRDGRAPPIATALEEGRDRIRRGGLRGRELVEWLAARPAAERERDFEELLGVAPPPGAPASLPAGLIGHVPSGVVAILRSVLDAPIAAGDRFVDLGAGVGKVAIAVHLLTGARAHGVEIQPALAERASGAAAALGLDGVTFETADARARPLREASVVYLYAPFHGPALAEAMERVREAARRRDLTVCALALDLGRLEWLAERPGDDLFFAIYDSRVPGAAPRSRPAPPELGPLARTLASGAAEGSAPRAIGD